MIIFSLFFVLALAANVSAEIYGIAKPLDGMGYSIPADTPLEVNGYNACRLNGGPTNVDPSPYSTVESFLGEINEGVNQLECWDIANPEIRESVYFTGFNPPIEEEIPEFPTAAIPAAVALLGYIGLKRLKKRE